MTLSKTSAERRRAALTVTALGHPQGCRTYLLTDPVSKQALAIDVHLDTVREATDLLRSCGWSLPYVLDTHTHADHPSGASALAAAFGSTRIAHEASGHIGVTRHPADGEVLHLGDHPVTVRHSPGHTPDHIALVADGAVFTGDTLLIGTVARTDFLGGDAGQLHDSLQSLLAELDDATVVYPGHDYAGRTASTVGDERAGNPWLQLEREEFVRRLTANPPPRPANMEVLLRLNREELAIPESISAAEAQEYVAAGGGTSVLDVRTGFEFDAEHVPGSRLVSLDQLAQRVDEVRAIPAPRLLLCRTGSRAALAREVLTGLGVTGLSVVEGGIEAYRAVGGEVEQGVARMSLERQVRIGAGSLALLGVVLGVLLHPGFLALSAFVSAGLIFAGITDWCGMGLLLARAPWNRSSAAAPGETGGCAAACALSPSAGSSAAAAQESSSAATSAAGNP